MLSDPLPDSVVVTLRTSETAALTASFVIAGAFPEVLAYAARVASPAREVPEAPKPASGRHVGNGRIVDGDEQVLVNLKACPDASIGQRARDLGCTRSTITDALERLALADMVRKTGRGAWIAIEPSVPAETARWLKPVSAQSDRRKRHAEEEEAEEVALHA
jgi:hypothetical protein